MLGWCPRPPLQHRTSGRSCLTQSHEIAHFSPLDDEKPSLQPSHQVVIGFDIGADCSKSLACQSPRSVLELQGHRPLAVSPLSALGSLLANRGCGGSTKKAEEFSADACSYHTFLKGEHVACGVPYEHVACGANMARAYNAMDYVMRSKQTKLRTLQDLSWESQSRGIGKPCFDATFSSDDEEDFEDGNDDDDVMVKSIFSAASPLPSYSVYKGVIKHSVLKNVGTGKLLLTIARTRNQQQLLITLESVVAMEVWLECMKELVYSIYRYYFCTYGCKKQRGKSFWC